MCLALSALLAVAVAALAPAGGDEARPPDLAYAPQRWALVIGANDYEHLGRLRYARQDARAFATALEERLGFASEAVRLLTDDAEDPELTPTAGHVLGELEALLADPRRTSSDLFVFYFCGHGAGLEQGDYLLPTDARLETAARLGLPVREVVERLTRAGMHNVLVLVDACREGVAHEFGRELEHLATEARLGVVLGCAPGAQSYEEARLGHGVFTHEFLGALDDGGLREPLSGAQWFSRVAAAAQERVRSATARKAQPQEPLVWFEPTRDVLLSAAPGGSPDGVDVQDFLGQAQRLGPAEHVAALTRYAEALRDAGRSADAVEVLKAAEQLGPLTPSGALLLYVGLLGLGRSGEAAQVLAELRVREAGALPALVATVVDQSGAVNDTERSLAAHELWQSAVQVPLDVLILMVQAHLRSGANAEGLEIARAALAQAPVETADQAFLSAVVALLDGDPARAAAEYERAEGLPGSLLELELLRAERLSALVKAERLDEAMALLTRNSEEWPEDGRWLAERAWLRRQGANSFADADAAVEDARAALERELLPAALLLVVRAAGSRVTELGPAVARAAEGHPLSWEAQLAAVMATQPADMPERVAAVSRLSPRPGLVYATMGRMIFDALIEQSMRMDAQKGADSPEAQALTAEFAEGMRYIQERLTPMAEDFGADARSWALLFDLYRRQGHYEAFVRLLERHLGPTIAAGRVPDELAQVIGPAWLCTGRLERFRTLRAVPRGPTTTDSLLWLEAAYLAARGEDAPARALLGERVRPLDSHEAQLAGPLVALLAARAGERERAAASLSGVGVESDPLAMALHYLALRALDDPAAVRWLESLSTHTPLDAFYTIDACLRARPGRDRRELAIFALSDPGNPLLAPYGFLPEARVEDFVGAQTYRLASAPGPLAVEGGTLTLTARKNGQVVGTLLGDGAALVVTGQVDAHGNFEGTVQGGAEPCTLLAKLVPRRAFDEYEALADGGQPLMLLSQCGVPCPWVAVLER